MGSAQDLISVARGYLGTTEDDPRFKELIDYYNEHTGGYDMRYWDEWCACFVSVCSLKSGNEDATGTSVNCAVFRSIWQDKGIYREPWETPEPGWLIDYDWEHDGIPDHIGIVVDCDGSTIHVIEGNTDGETCAEHWIPVGCGTISCFGAPDYSEDDDMTDEQIQKLAKAIYREFADPIGDDKKKQWGPNGKGSGDLWRNWYNLQRWYYDLLVSISGKLDAIIKKMG